MSPVRVLVIAPDDASYLQVLRPSPGALEVTVGPGAAVLASAAPNADVVLVGMGQGAVLRELWPRLTQVRWVHALSAGVEGVLFPALRESAVPLTNARGVYAVSLAEFCLGAMLAFAKDFRRLIRNQQAGRWERFTVEEVRGRTVVVLGYGEIGRAVAVRARAMGMRVIGVRRRPAPDEHATVVGLERKLEVVREADYLVVAAPLTPDTVDLVGEAELRAMKRHAVLINVGRGPSVHEPSLIRALEEGWIRGAALDVFEVEPLPAGHRFYALENVLLSPHCADQTATWLQESMALFLENLERFQAGQPLRNVVDKALGY
ncbi:MAG: D-2-hydroxyacid dehydrogenase [Myxococcota bacterium]